MIRQRFISIAITALVIFFLTFLGMRISFLDPHPKPKPRPRAVLNQLSKTYACSINTEFQKHQLTHLVSTLEAIKPAVAEGMLLPTLPLTIAQHNIAETANSRAPPSPSSFIRS